MNKLQTTISAFLVLFCPLVLGQTNLIYNVHGYTINNNQLKNFNAIQFTNDKIDKLYSKNQALPNKTTIKRINGQGSTLLPGLIDAHGHILNYGLSLLWANLNQATSAQDAVNKVIKFHQKPTSTNLKQTWLFGRGWNQTRWPDKSFPTAKSLDKAFPNTPVLLKRVDGHAIWVNSAAMKLAGINKHTKTPDGGEIIKDKSGKPTGIFIDNAMDLINKIVPPLSDSQQKKILVQAMQKLASEGITSVHDAGISKKNLELYQTLSQDNELPIRVYAMFDINDKQLNQVLERGVYSSPDTMFSLNSVKISSDGALGSRGAAMLADYSDVPNHQGLLLYDNKQLRKLMKKAMQAGFQVNTHAIGDRANKIVLDQYQELIPLTNSKNLRHRIEHAQVLQLADIPRFAELNIIASIQSTHATSDKNMAEDRIGKQRLAGAYAWRKLIDSGAHIANGSDFPVEASNPFFGLHAAITRQDQQNQPLNGWLSNEKMNKLEAFKSFTLDGAYAAHQEQEIGSLAPNKKADFILINQNIFNIPEQNIWKTKVLATWVNGREIYKAKKQ